MRAVTSGRLEPARLVLMSSRMHAAPPGPGLVRTWKAMTMLGAVPGLDRALSYAAYGVVRPRLGSRLSIRGNAAARDLVRHAFSDVAGNGNRARSWAKLARHWPVRAHREYVDAYGRLDMPVLLLWAREDPYHPLAIAEEALDRLPNGQLRVLPGTGFLMAYDDPVGVARELAAFCG